MNKIYEHKWLTKVLNKSCGQKKPQNSKQNTELQHSARLGKTFVVGWVAGWLVG